MRALLVAVGFSAALLICEGIARVASWTAWPMQSAATPATRSDLPELKTLFDLARPNASGIYKGSYYRSNRSGFRGPDYDEVPSTDVFRIIVAGDSITMGEGVLEEEAYPALLEVRLNEGGSSRKYEVLNLGLSGLTTIAVGQRLENLGLQYHPDLIVYGFTLNDIETPPYRATVTVPERNAQRAAYFRPTESPSHLIRALYPRMLGVRELLFAGPGSYVYDLRQNYLHNPEAWKGFLVGLDRIAAVGRESQACIHLFIHTQLYAVNFLHPFHPIYEKVTEAAKARGFTVTNPFSRFSGHDERSLSLAADDPHPNATGHGILAEALYDGVRGLPRECWVNRAGTLFEPIPR